MPVDPLLLLAPDVDELEDPAGVVGDEVPDDEVDPDVVADALSEPVVVALTDGVTVVVLVTDAGPAADAVDAAGSELPQAARNTSGLRRAAVESARRVVVIPRETTERPRRLAPLSAQVVRR